MAVAAATLLVALGLGPGLPPVGAVPSAPPARAEAGSAQPAARSTVVVVLRDQVAPETATGVDRAARIARVIDRLRAHSARTQAPLRTRLRALAAQGEVTAVVPLWVTNAVSVTATDRAVRELAARADVASVNPDAITVLPTTTAEAATATVPPGIAVVRAPDLWAHGHTGQGVVVATLDTGVDLARSDLAASWRGGANSWFDPYGQHQEGPVDLDGHGTATTGVIVGGDAAGTSYGMAPGARWIAARIFDDRGAASATAMHQAFQWLLDPDRDPTTADAPHVVNSSWVLGSGPSCDLSFRPDVAALRAAGILPVFAAGNFGPSTSTSASPANYPESLSVGAVNDADVVWAYSGSGPSTCGGRARVFPDLVAPGVSVLTADRYGGYQSVTGTSIAAPHVAGAAALVLSSHPGLGVASQTSALTSSTVDLGVAGPDVRYGSGRLDVAAADAVAAPVPDVTVSATPTAASTAAGGAVTVAVAAVPVDGFAAPLTLSLQGTPTTGAVWTFTPGTLSTNSWSSTLVVTTSAGLAPGTYPLTVTASGGGATRTAGVVLTVTPAPDFTIGVSPTTLGVKRGQAGSATVAVGSVGGFSGPVGVSLSALPIGVSASWSANPVAASGSTTLRLVVSRRAKPGTYALPVTGTSGGRTHGTGLSLVVK